MSNWQTLSFVLKWRNDQKRAQSGRMPNKECFREIDIENSASKGLRCPQRLSRHQPGCLATSSCSRAPRCCNQQLWEREHPAPYTYRQVPKLLLEGGVR